VLVVGSGADGRHRLALLGQLTCSCPIEDDGENNDQHDENGNEHTEQRDEDLDERRSEKAAETHEHTHDMQPRRRSSFNGNRRHPLCDIGRNER
jgi:hypothetical protein